MVPQLVHLQQAVAGSALLAKEGLLAFILEGGQYPELRAVVRKVRAQLTLLTLERLHNNILIGTLIAFIITLPETPPTKIISPLSYNIRCHQ